MENTTKNLFDSIIETQNKAVNNWIETTQKFQKAALGGQAIEKGTELYKEWVNNQMNILTNATTEFKNNATEVAEKMTKNLNTEEYFKNWYQNQLSVIKQFMDINQNFYNSFVNFGKPTNEVSESYTKMNETFNTIYNSWQNTINTTFNNFYANLLDSQQKAFKNILEGANFYSKMQEVFSPVLNNINTGNWNQETFKNLMDPSKIKEVTEKIFGSFFQYPNVKELFDGYAKSFETFFHNNTTVSKEIIENIRNTWSHMPNLISGDFAKLTGVYNQFNNLLHTTYGPLMRLIAQSPEKRNWELILETNDKFATFFIKQAQLQYLLYTATQHTMEKTAEFIAEKTKNGSEVKSIQQIFTEWVSIAEKVYLDLFNSEEYSKLKGEVLSEGMALKKLVEKQFENYLENSPFIFRSEMDELYKTIHDLKKKVRDLESRLAISNAVSTEFDDEKLTTNKASSKRK